MLIARFSLRRHYPDQVRRVGAAVLLSASGSACGTPVVADTILNDNAAVAETPGIQVARDSFSAAKHAPQIVERCPVHRLRVG